MELARLSLRVKGHIWAEGSSAASSRPWFTQVQRQRASQCAACREDPPGSRAAGKKRKLADAGEEEAAWSTVCLTLEDLQEFAQKLGTSRQAGCLLHLLQTPLMLKQLSAKEAVGPPTDCI